MEQQKHEISFKFDKYNDRRFSKPWGAVVMFSGLKPEYHFNAATFWGDGDEGGEVVFSVAAGTILAVGQRDNRGGKQSSNEWHVVNPDGTTRPVTKREAFDHWKAEQAKARMKQ